MSDTKPETLNVREKLAEARKMVRQATDLLARHETTDAALRELSGIWNDPQAADYRKQFNGAAKDIEAFLKSSKEYVAFLEKLEVVDGIRAGEGAGGGGSAKSKK